MRFNFRIKAILVFAGLIALGLIIYSLHAKATTMWQDLTVKGSVSADLLTSSTGQATAPSGAVSAPGVSFTGDLDNGLYWIGADSWALSVGGNKVMEVGLSSGGHPNIGLCGRAPNGGDNIVMTCERDHNNPTLIEINNSTNQSGNRAGLYSTNVNVNAIFGTGPSATGTTSVKDRSFIYNLTGGAGISMVAPAAGSKFGIWLEDAANAGEMFRAVSGGVAITDTGSIADPDATTLLDLVSTTQGLGLPEMTTAQRDSITCSSRSKLISNTTTGKINYCDGSAWGEVSGSGDGGGGINYVSNSDAETDTTGWTQYDDGASATIVDATGGSANDLTFSATTTQAEIVRGSQSFKMALGSTDSQGEGVSITLSQIDPKDIGDILEVRFDYKTKSDYTSGDIYVGLYNVTDSSIVECDNDDDADIIKASTLGSQFLCQFTPQDTDSDDTADTYRLAFHVATTATSTWLTFDNVKVGPPGEAPTVPMTEWAAYTPTFTGFGTVSASEFYYRRVGSDVEIRGDFTVGTPTTTEARISLPSGLTASSSISTLEGCGGVGTTASSGTGNDVLALCEPSVAYITVRDNTGQTALRKADADEIAAAASTLTAHAKVPIEGWSAGAVMSTTDNTYQAVEVIYEVSASTANSSFADTTFERIDADTKIKDKHSLVTTGASWVFTAPIAGSYEACGNISWANNTNLTQSGLKIISSNGDEIFIINNLSAAQNAGAACAKFDLSTGDTLHAEARQNDSGASARDIETSRSGANRVRLSVEHKPEFRQWGTRGEVEHIPFTSDTKTPGTTGDYLQMTNNSAALPPGSWECNGGVDLGTSGTADYAGSQFVGWHTANGADSSSEPATLQSSLDAGFYRSTGAPASATQDFDYSAQTVRLTVAQDTTVYLVPRAFMSTASNARVTVYGWCERLQ